MLNEKMVTQEGVKESQHNLQYSVKYADSVLQFPSKVYQMITQAKDIEFIVSLYPNQLRNLHTVFQLEIDGATTPIFLHSQVAYTLIKISQGQENSLRNYIQNCIEKEILQSFVVVDDGLLIDMQIVLILILALKCCEDSLSDQLSQDLSQLFPIILQDNIDTRHLAFFLNKIEFMQTECSKIYINEQDSVVKMPLLEDDNKMFIINKIYERQIKRVIQYFHQDNQLAFAKVIQSLDLFVISSSDPSVFLNYASISFMNFTLDAISDPDELEYWILIVLDYLAFLHRILNLVNLDIKPQNIFLGTSRKLQKSGTYQDRGSNLISMDMGSALTIDLEEDRQYYVQFATKEYCSPKFWEAFNRQTPLSAKELIEEDHYQILSTLDAVCKGRQDLTQETKFMLEILRSSNTIENAIYRISRNLELIHKVFSGLMNSEFEVGFYAISFLRNLDPEGQVNKPLKSIELLLQCEPYDLAKQLLDYAMCYLYPKFLFEDIEKEFRYQFISLSIICNMQWLSPLLVLVDYLESYQDETEEQIRKQLTLLLETISQLPVTDQIKTFYAIRKGFHLFMQNCKEDSKANWFYFSNHVIKRALQLTELSEKDRKMLKILDEKYSLSTKYDSLQVVPAFRKKSFIPYDFIARHSYPKGLFQVFQSGGTNYFLSLTCQPNRFYREINAQQLIELPYFEYMVQQCDDRQMIVVDRDGDIMGFQNDSKFIEIEFNKADEHGRMCFVQVVSESGSYLITGLMIEKQQIP